MWFRCGGIQLETIREISQPSLAKMMQKILPAGPEPAIRTFFR